MFLVMDRTTGPGTPAAALDVDQLEEAFSALGRTVMELMTSRVLSPWSRKLTGELDRTSYLALAVLKEGGPTRVTELAQAMKLDVSTVSRAVHQLSEASLVDKERDGKDGRAHLIALSGKGRQLLDAACSAKRELLHAATSGWTHEERASLAAQMMRLARSLADIEDLPTRSESGELLVVGR